MIGRRAFMAALGFAPVAGAISGKGEATAVSVVGSSPPDPIFEAANRHMRNKAERAESRLHQSGQHLPPSIASKKSWSLEFKVHAFEQERRRFEHLMRLYELDREEMIALAIKNGLDL